ncbi:MAG: undecaprenyl-diphosphate phosphatase [Calditrichaeota bacterium]|nr:undecaprenyl-diphosphate phosphatase [Calditrichota bacterium]MCB9366346.1 undecaprenyl-diphosphate phosphatase [Calditrichota bacterium]
MQLWEAILLGLAQGLTEFLPVSSSGHLVVLQHVLGFREPLLTFDIMVHLGTLLAVLIYYRSKLLNLSLGLLGPKRTAAMRTILLVAIATVPAVVFGLLLKDKIEHAFGNPLFVALMWMAFGIVAIASARWTMGRRDFESLKFGEAVLIGCAQAVAILPGVSRSGSTIIAGMTRKLRPAAAADFSFLLAIPAIGGAGILQLKDADMSGIASDPAIMAGAAVSFLVGYAAIALLLRLLGRGIIRPFGIYCVSVSAITLIMLLLNGNS